MPLAPLALGLLVGALVAGALALVARRRDRTRTDALRSDAARCHALLDGAPDAAFVHAVGGGDLALNRAARAALGLGDASAPPSLIDVVAMADRAAARAHLATLAETGYARSDLRLTGFEARLVEITSRTVEGGMALSLARDVGAQRAHEARLVEARDQAEEAARVRSAYLAQMSHEIRTPLTSVIGFTEILRDEVAEPQRGLVDAIGAGGQRLLTTLDAVMDLATLDARRETLRPQPVDVVDEVERAIDRVRAEAEAKGLALRLAPCRAALAATLDADALGRILAHVLGNAVQYTEVGSVTVELDADADTVSLRVLDTGIGIPEDAQARLFDGFRAEDAGFGLAITHRLVELMGGSISVESQWRSGTAVTVAVPRGEAVTEAAGVA